MEATPTSAIAPARISVIVVSRGRPEALARCLMGLAQLDHPAFEIVVVADPSGLAATAPWAGRIKALAFDEANISAARNLGVGAAAGEVLAFIDDDAVPEPLWLAHLGGAFADRRVACAGGFVRGADGLSWQWRAREVMGDASSRPLAVDARAVTVLTPAPGRATRTEGTNMAVRAGVLRGLGGFDAGYRFWLDETDLNWRLARAGHATAIVPLAEVHHGALESDRRRADRVPRSLCEVGASLAVWARRHGPAPGRLDAERAERRRSLLGHMVAGRIEPGCVGRLLATLDEGHAEGRARDLPPLAPLAASEAAFLPFRADPPRRGHVVLAATPWGARAARAEAARHAAAGAPVTLLVLWRTARPHRATLLAQGVWVQEGGLWGPSERTDPRLRPWRRAARVAREAHRLEAVRGPALAP